VLERWNVNPFVDHALATGGSEFLDLRKSRSGKYR
jgi:hypothetical protein